jgi:hypothetical protein
MVRPLSERTRRAPEERFSVAAPASHPDLGARLAASEHRSGAASDCRLGAASNRRLGTSSGTSTGPMPRPPRIGYDVVPVIPNANPRLRSAPTLCTVTSKLTYEFFLDNNNLEIEGVNGGLLW